MNRETKGLINAFYITLLGILLGSTMALGAFAAPVIFKANLFFDVATIDQFESGKLMSEIFRRYSYLLIFSLVVVAAYEIYEIIKGEKGKAIVAASAITLIAGGLFAFYYTPAILHAQSIGVEATLGADFATIHKQAEAAFKLLSASVAMMIFLRVLKIEGVYKS